jgi:hypothetical protein
MTTNGFYPGIPLSLENKAYLMQFDPNQFDEGYQAGLHGVPLKCFHIQDFMNGYNRGAQDREINKNLPMREHVYHPFHPAPP